MTKNPISKVAMISIAAAIMATSVAAPVQAAGPASANTTNSVFQPGDAQIILVGGGHRKGKKFGHRRNRHGHGHRHGGGRGWGHNYHGQNYGGCFFRKKRFWDGHGYYYRNVRVCF